ncbi:MAG: hypothetical protein IPH80_22785 [Myxococcales bacterium]|nr:hypothetical protein [Myxococcales bacterium]
MDPSPVARSRGPLIAGALAGLALVLAAVTAVVVLGRDRGGASTGQVRLVEARTSATALAAAIAGTPLRLDGGRMLATDPAALGLAPGDLVRTIGGAPVESAAAGRAQLRRLLRARPETLLLEVERAGAIVVVRVAIDGDRAALTARPDLDALAANNADLTMPPPPAPDDPSGAPAVAGITKVDDTHAVITRATVDQLLADPMATAKGVRVVPSIQDGEPDGFKLYAMRRSSPFAALGFANGDTVHRINGEALTSMDRALEIYAKLRDATRLEVELTRRGRPTTLTIDIR